MKKILAGIILILGLGTLSFGADKSLSKIKKAGKMVVGLDDTFAPMGFRDKKGKIVGFDIDLANETAKRLGIKAEFKPLEWDGIIFDLRSKKIDMVWNGMTITKEREAKIAFSKPYFQDGQIIFSKKSRKIKKIVELEGKKVGVQLGSSADFALQKSDIFSKVSKVKKYSTNVEALMDLEAGRIDAVVMDTVAGRYYNSKKNSLSYSSESLTKEYYGIGMRKEDKEFIKAINETLDEMKADGTFTKIYEKWFGKEEN